MKLLPILFGITLLIPATLRAQTSPELGASEIKQGLKKLNTVGSVLYMAAHPDDENTRLLTYLSKERNLRTGYLALTRGDGGQNLIGPEQAEMLGLLRTQELLAARRIDGAEQFFSRANDFGFSKTADETFSIWGKEQILADAVWVIRNFRPDVIITRFPEDSRAGHGHHAASAIIAREAFMAAADPKRFPEQLKFVQPWQAKRLLWNTYNFGGTNTTSADQLKIDVGGYNPLLGKSYGEIAAESRSSHKSQGFGSIRQRGQSFEFFSPVAGPAPASDLFDGIDQSWNRLKGGAEISTMISQALKEFNPEKPSASVPALIHILTKIEQLPDSSWRLKKAREVKDLIAAAAGLWFESYAAVPSYALGDSIQVRSEVIIRNPDVAVKWKNGPAEQRTLVSNVITSAESSLYAARISQPYWLTENHSPGSYVIKDQQLAGNAQNPDPLSATFTFNIAGKEIVYTRPVVYKFADPVKGEIYQPLVIAPPVTASIAQNSYVFRGSASRVVQVQLKNFRKASSGTIVPQVPAGWKINPQQATFAFPEKGDEQTLEFTVTPAGSNKSGEFSLKINLEDQTFDRALRVISYDHIPTQTLFPKATARLESIDLQTDGKRVGYLAGAGDMIPEALRQVGYEVVMLNENEILHEDLSGFDAIIAGVRAYNVNPRLKYIQAKLMDFVKNGGTYLVQYNVNQPLMVPEMGPYPFSVTGSRVTREDAPVQIKEPDNRVLNYPNKISDRDFQGWIQERGVYFVSDADPRYHSLLRMNDPDETPNDGALIVSDYGKGRFVYTSLAFFRQLPAGVPGAYRLFVNLIAKNKS